MTPLSYFARLRRRQRHLVYDIFGGSRFVLGFYESQACSFRRVIPEIDIWRAATLMLKRYGESALAQSAARAEELAAVACSASI